MPQFFDHADFTRFRQQRENYGIANIAPLYRLFSTDPEHLDPAVTREKFNLLSSKFRAHIGGYVGYWLRPRGIGGDDPRTNWIADACHNDERFGRILSLAQLPDGFSQRSMRRAVRINKAFVELIKTKVGARASTKGPISFCSKYLHFHTKIHPIYDNDATSSLYLMSQYPQWARMLAERRKRTARWGNKFDYAALCQMELEVLTAHFPAHVNGFTTEVKQLDNYLIALYRKQWSAFIEP